MAKPEQLPEISDYSRRFAVALTAVMAERGVSQSETARRIGRTQGYVSERVRGVRAPDTDVIAGVAQVAGVPASMIVRETLAKMKALKVVLDSGDDPSL